METKKKKKRVWLIVLIVVIVLVVVIAVVSAIRKITSGIESISNTVQVEQVQTRDLSDYISLTGSVSGESITNVVSEASAEVLAVNVQVGDTISAGDELVTLDTTELEKQIEELKKQISNADALSQNEASMREKSLTEAKEDRDTAVNRASEAVTEAQNQVDNLSQELGSLSSSIENKKTELSIASEKIADLEPLKDASPEQELAYNEAKAAYDTINGELSLLQEQKTVCEQSLSSAQSALSGAKESYSDTVTNSDRAVSAAQNTIDMAKYQTDGTADLNTQLEALKQQLADCKLIAPCSGVITAVNVSVGDRYSAGQTMITIEDTNVLKVAVEVKESDILRLSEGMKAIIKTTATGEEEISGTVTRVVRVKNQSVNVNNMEGAGATGGYSAEITIDNADLLIGMSATAKIILQEKKGILAVPYDLVKYDEDGNAYVLVAEDAEEGQSVAVRKNITVGEEIDYYIEVTGGELLAGDLLIYDYTGMIAEGSTFLPQQVYNEETNDADKTDVEVEN